MPPPRASSRGGVFGLRRSVREHASDPRHAGPVDGADRVGAGGGARGVHVSIGIWLDWMGRVEQARWVATPSDTDALAAYAEIACTLLESGVAPDSVDANALRRTLGDGVPPAEQQAADAVAEAIRGAIGGLP